MAKKSLDISSVRELHKAGRLDDAEWGYLNLLRIHPRDPELLHSLGIICSQKRNFPDAIKYLETAIHYQPKDPSLPLNLANILKLQGLYSQAIQVLEKTIKEHPDYPPIFNNLGTIYYSQGKIDEAIQAYKKAIIKYPSYVDAHYNLGLAYSKKNQSEEAIQTFKHLLSLSHDHLAARFHLACIYMQKENISAAIKEFHQIELAQPFHFETQTNLATCYLKQGQIKEAKTHYFKALELKPEDTQILFNFGVMNMQEDQVDQAIQFYQQAVMINPDFFAAHNNLAIAFLAKQHIGYALKHFQEAFRIQPANKALRYTIQALSENRQLLAAPPDYIQSLFDAYADHYEAHLLKALDYKIPQVFEKNLIRYLKPSTSLSILDLGCGTGLCGMPFKPYAKKLVGIDLSTKMLEIAAQKNIYDELITADLTHYLKDKPNAFDLILAGDVFVYIGELQEIFYDIYTALRQDGIFIFNTEINEQNDYCMNQSGRFSHKKSYLDSLAEKNHFKVLHYQTCLTRTQNNEDVFGHLYILLKR